MPRLARLVVVASLLVATLVLGGPPPFAAQTPAGEVTVSLAAFMYSKGASAYGGSPDLDELFLQQSRERDPVKREALLHRIQQLTIGRVMFAPLMDLRGLIAVGPRVADHTINSIPMFPFPSYEEMRLKNP